MTDRKKQYYAVVHGRKPGIYSTWFGPDGAAEQVENFPESVYKGFYTEEEMRQWLEQFEDSPVILSHLVDLIDQPISASANDVASLLSEGKIVIYADGAASGNPGPGGYGIVLLHKQLKKELSGGFRRTTNNRMELLACIIGLKELRFKCNVVLFSDSKYVVDGISKGWAKKWRANGWMRNKKDKAENADLWAEMLDICDKHDVEFRWIRGHYGHLENERCDQLAMQAAKQDNLPPDKKYETRSS